MTLQLELSHMISLFLAVAGMLGGLAKVLLASIKSDFRRIEEQNKVESEGWKRLERELLELKAELPERYVRREDYVRGQTVIEAKLDALYNKLELAQVRAAKGQL